MDRLIKRNGFVWAIRARLPWVSFERGNNREDPPSKTEGGAPRDTEVAEHGAR